MMMMHVYSQAIARWHWSYLHVPFQDWRVWEDCVEVLKGLQQMRNIKNTCLFLLFSKSKYDKSCLLSDEARACVQCSNSVFCDAEMGLNIGLEKKRMDGRRRGWDRGRGNDKGRGSAKSSSSKRTYRDLVFPLTVSFVYRIVAYDYHEVRVVKDKNEE